MSITDEYDLILSKSINFLFVKGYVDQNIAVRVVSTDDGLQYFGIIKVVTTWVNALALDRQLSNYLSTNGWTNEHVHISIYCSSENLHQDADLRTHKHKHRCKFKINTLY